MKKIHYLKLFVLLGLSTSLLFLYQDRVFSNKTPAPNFTKSNIDKESSPPSLQKLDTASNTATKIQTITVKAGTVQANIPIISGITLYQLIRQFSPELALQGKEYNSLGFFVTDIGNLHQGNGKYLMYYINNQEASMGISLYVPKNGDIIEWKLK